MLRRGKIVPVPARSGAVRTRLRRAAALGLFSMLLSLRAFAHAHPTAMEPAADSTVSAPERVTVTFSEAVEPGFSKLKVTAASGAVVSNGPPQTADGDPKKLTVGLNPLPPGEYTVHWVSVATDGHRLEGAYKFAVK